MRAAARERCISAERSREIAASEAAAWEGRIADRPFVLLSQPTLFDPSRAPAGRHVAWGYCHVPRGIDRRHARPHRASDRTIRAGVPRLRARAIDPDAGATSKRTTPNLVGGDIAAGVTDLRQFFTRPTLADLLDAGEGAVHLFGLHAARRRRARHVRILRREARARGSLRTPVDEGLAAQRNPLAVPGA